MLLFLRAALALIVLSALAATPAWSHAQGEDYVFLNFYESSIEGLFEVHFEDLREKLGLDLGSTDEEAERLLTQHVQTIWSHSLDGFDIGPVGGPEYELEFVRHEVGSLPQGRFAVLHFRADTGPLPDELAVRHSMYYEGDRLHRGLLLIQYNQKTDTTYPGEYTALVFSPGNQEQVLDLIDVPGLMTPWDMIPQGVLHIWIGIDHILFLLALMLTTVLVRKDDGWEGVDGFPSALWNLLKIVTVFTVAHSVTLLLAALDFISLPSRLVESVIALSIVLVALNNVFAKVKEGSLLIVLLLGLFHGLGFASVMGHLPFRMLDILKTVIGFNIGVELGQIAIVAVVFPILFALRKTEAYRTWIVTGTSLVLAAIATWWFVQRAFDLG